jgi:hypothetical protein
MTVSKLTRPSNENISLPVRLSTIIVHPLDDISVRKGCAIQRQRKCTQDIHHSYIVFIRTPFVHQSKFSAELLDYSKRLSFLIVVN